MSSESQQDERHKRVDSRYKSQEVQEEYVHKEKRRRMTPSVEEDNGREPSQHQEQSPRELGDVDAVFSGKVSKDDASSRSNSNKKTENVVIVHGIRYVRPYLQYQPYSIRLQHAGLTVLDVLSTVFKREHCSQEETIEYFRKEIMDGRIQYKRSSTSFQPEESSGSKQFITVKDPNFVVIKNDRLQILKHIHERCTIGTTIHEIPFILDDESEANANRDVPLPQEFYKAVFKPAGLPVIGGDHGTSGGGRTGENGRIGDSSSLQGLMRQDGGWYVGHRIDLPVSGIVLVGKGKGRAKRIMQHLTPDAKKTQLAAGFVKAYLARVHGRPKQLKHGSSVGSTSTIREQVECQLIWDSRQKKSLIVGVDDGTATGMEHNISTLPHEGLVEGQSTGPKEQAARSSKTKTKDTTTYVEWLEYNPENDTSLVRVELVTGSRQQIRAVLGTWYSTPIVGDTTYGGQDYYEFYPSNGSSSNNDNNKGEKNDEQQQSSSHQKSKAHVPSDLRLYRDDDDGTLSRLLQDEYQPWCDKCRWQLDCCQGRGGDGGGVGGGTTLGIQSLTHQICLLSYHYCIPTLGINAIVPDHLVPHWARRTETEMTLGGHE